MSNAKRYYRPNILAACGLALLAVALTPFSLRAQATAKARDARQSAAPAETAPERFAKEIASFETYDTKNSFPQDSILFVGSSSIRLWKTADAFPELPVLNRGFDGSTIADAITHFDRIVLKYKPRLIVFYSGDNDIASGKSPQKVFDNFLEFVRLTEAGLPKTPILFISIKPSILRAKFWPEMQEVNAMVAKLAESNPQVRYIDVATPMLAGQELPSKDLFLGDGLHLNAAGYDVWNQALAPALERR